MVWKGFPAFPAHLRMRPVPRGNSRRATWVGPQAERPRFRVPLLRRTRGPDPSSKATLWVKAQHEGALTHLCIIRKNGQVTYTARQVACHLENNSRGKRSPILQKRRGLTLLYQHAGTLRSESEMERNTEVPASTRDESLLHSTKCRGVSRGPSKLHSIPDFSEAL